jgi:hypothetical protein
VTGFDDHPMPIPDEAAYMLEHRRLITALEDIEADARRMLHAIEHGKMTDLDGGDHWATLLQLIDHCETIIPLLEEASP